MRCSRFGAANYMLNGLTWRRRWLVPPTLCVLWLMSLSATAFLSQFRQTDGRDALQIRPLAFYYDGKTALTAKGKDAAVAISVKAAGAHASHG